MIRSGRYCRSTSKTRMEMATRAKMAAKSDGIEDDATMSRSRSKSNSKSRSRCLLWFRFPILSLCHSSSFTAFSSVAARCCLFVLEIWLFHMMPCSGLHLPCVRVQTRMLTSADVSRNLGARQSAVRHGSSEQGFQFLLLAFAQPHGVQGMYMYVICRTRQALSNLCERLVIATWYLAVAFVNVRSQELLSHSSSVSVARIYSIHL